MWAIIALLAVHAMAHEVCPNTEKSFHVFIGNDVQIQSGFYNLQSENDERSPSCKEGRFYNWDAVNYNPAAFEKGSTVPLDVNCSVSANLCVQTTDGRYWKGFTVSENGVPLNLYATVFAKCKRGRVCETLLISDLDGTHSQTQAGFQSGLLEVDGPLRLFTNLQYQHPGDLTFGRHFQFSSFHFLKVKGITCNGCQKPFNYCQHDSSSSDQSKKSRKSCKSSSDSSSSRHRRHRRNEHDCSN